MNLENPQIFFVFFVSVWLLVGLFLAQMSGWAQLARYYRPETVFEGERRRFRSSKMRWLTHYHNCLTAGADTKGLHLAVLFLFRVGHPPLFVPWHDVMVRQGKKLFWPWTEFTFNQAPSVWVRFYGRLGDQICRAAGPAWPGNSPSATVGNS
jgi:hypothetical protein